MDSPDNRTRHYRRTLVGWGTRGFGVGAGAGAGAGVGLIIVYALFLFLFLFLFIIHRAHIHYKTDSNKEESIQ